MHLIRRQTCRVCGSSALTKVIDLGEQYLQGNFVKGDNQPPVRKIPMVLVRCDPTRDEKACGLLQSEYTVPPEILYSKYWYRSGTNQTMCDHLESIADEAVSMVSGNRVLDIGCNDGTLLGFFPADSSRTGIDPSDIILEVYGIDTIQDTFPSPQLWDEKFDVITSIAMFYDLENPVEFVRAIKKHLAFEGIWIFEVSYMPSMLIHNSYDTICAEHLEYYSLAVLERVLKRCQMKIVRVGLNDINGGSIFCIATHSDNLRPEEGLAELRQSEFDMELDTDKPYRNFQERVRVHGERLGQLVRALKSDGKRIHVLGASTKGNTILQWCGIDNKLIDYAADRNPAKHGARTLGTDIPIISEEESRAMKPDAYLVLPWHFRREIIEREKDSGVKLIFPLPEIEIV